MYKNTDMTPTSRNRRPYVNIPVPLAAAIGIEAGEEVEWELLSRGELRLLRPHAPKPSPR